MSTLPPRVVIVTRETDYESLVARHATKQAAQFHLETRGQSLPVVEKRHEAVTTAIQTVRASIPHAWRQTSVRRAELDRFLFEPGDLIVPVGPDGLVANVAKYLEGQPVIGVNPDPAHIDGVLARIAPQAVGETLAAVSSGRALIEMRTMVEARLDSGETLLAVNEIFVGHRSHQSALYDIQHEGRTEKHSSSGLIVASGTGATGWARSIMTATGNIIALDPRQPAAAFFVREAWPSRTTDTQLVSGKLTRAKSLRLTSRMDGGVVFADGIEQDYLSFGWGSNLCIGPASRKLALVVG